MKKLIYIICFTSIASCFSQNEKVFEYGDIKQNDSIKDLYIYIDSGKFFGSNGQYSTSFSIISKDLRFSHDNFVFTISDNQLEERNIYKIGKRIDIDTIKYVKPNIYFENKSMLDIHDELSLFNINYDKQIFIITFIQKKQIYMIWDARYGGTIRDVVYTQLGKGPFLTEK